MSEAVGRTSPTAPGVKSDLLASALGLPGVIMQGLAAIAPTFAILATFQFAVSLPGVVAPLPAPPAKYAPIVFGVYVALGFFVLVYPRLSRREEFLDRAHLAMELGEREPIEPVAVERAEPAY